MASSRIAVVGGGIVGVSVAYHLSELTTDPVDVYERGELASETTFKATAMIGVAGSDPYHRMKEYGFRLYNEFFADPAAEPRYRQSGRLRIATTEAGAKTLAEHVSHAHEQTSDEDVGTSHATKYANSLVDYIPGGKLHDRFLLPPLATEHVEGALYRPQYGYIQDESRTLGPRELAFEFVERARENGVRFKTNTEVTDIATDGDSVTGIEIDDTTIVDVDSVVCAAGPWNDTLTSYAGLDLPIEHFRSPVYSLALDEPLPYSLPTVKAHEASVGIHPKRADRILVTYTPEEERRTAHLSTISNTVPNEYRERALQSAERLLPALENATLTDEWVGIGTATPDSHPIVGWTDIDGLALAVTMSGIQYAPAVGSIVARQLVDQDPTPFYDAVSISRFDGYDDHRTDGNTD